MLEDGEQGDRDPDVAHGASPGLPPGVGQADQRREAGGDHRDPRGRHRDQREGDRGAEQGRGDGALPVDDFAGEQQAEEEGGEEDVEAERLRVADQVAGQDADRRAADPDG